MNTKTRNTSRAVVATVAAMLCIFSLTACDPEVAGRFETRDLINKTRAQHRLRELDWNASANTKAQKWAEKLAREGRLYHSNVMSNLSGVCSAAENVAYAIDGQTVHDTWMNSPSHRSNILGRGWNQIGVGAATGTIDGWEVTFRVTVFVRTC